jgi:hypothetical protein
MLLVTHLRLVLLPSQVYAALKEAISTLSPIIRNRLRGLPAYVLDYSDLIPPNRSAACLRATCAAGLGIAVLCRSYCCCACRDGTSSMLQASR